MRPSSRGTGPVTCIFHSPARRLTHSSFYTPQSSQLVATSHSYKSWVSPLL